LSLDVTDLGLILGSNAEAKSMKVILLEDVKGVGEAGSVETVADGYARHFLIPRKLAIAAGAGELKELELHRRSIKRRQAADASNGQAVADRLADVTLRLKAKAGEGGRLFGSVTHAMVADALETEHEVKVDRRSISFPYPIKVVGRHEAKVRVHKDVEATLAIEVEPEQEAEDEA
jgi:large subunit ribosomal protein L9